MLVLTFQVAEVPYAVAVRRVVEVVPRVELRTLPTRRNIWWGSSDIEEGRSRWSIWAS